MVTPRQDPEPTVTRVRRPWTKRFSPAELDAVFRDYDAGATGTTICSRYGVSRATLYRWIGEYEKEPRAECSITFLRARVAVLEACVVRLSVKLAERENANAEHESAASDTLDNSNEAAC